MKDELAAWQALGMQTVNNFFDKIHDHGQYQDSSGEWHFYPSGTVGEICKTCGKLIEPLDQSLDDEHDPNEEESDPNAEEESDDDDEEEL